MNNEAVIEALQHLVGSTYDASIKATITQLTGRKRVVGPGEVSTKEYDVDRVKITADTAGTIKGFTFG